MDHITHLTSDFAVTGALQPSDFAIAAGLGFRSIVSNRPDGEDVGQLTAADEAELARAAGLEFRHVPTTKHAVFSDTVVEAMASAIMDLPGPVLAHCKSGIRSTLAWSAAQARSHPVDHVLAILSAAQQDLEFLRDDLMAQAARSARTDV